MWSMVFPLIKIKETYLFQRLFFLSPASLQKKKNPEANHLYKKEEVGSFPPTDATTSAVCLNRPKCDWSMKQNSLMKKTLLSAA